MYLIIKEHQKIRKF